jgi:hypothetical protein
MKSTIIISCILLCALSAYSSEEILANWTDVSVRTEEISEAGVVAFRATAGEEGFREIVLEAFGREIALDESQKAVLADFPLRSLRITYEAGYPNSGGFTVHYRFDRLHYVDGKETEESLILSIPKESKLKITQLTKQDR